MLKYELGNIETSVEDLEEICGNLNLGCAIDFLSLAIFKAKCNIKKSLKDSPVRVKDIEQSLDDISIASSIMVFLTKINNEVDVLPAYIEGIKYLLSQEGKEGGDNHGN